MLHFAVIGFPVAHSRSPELYSELFEKYSVSADFVRLPIQPDEIRFLRELTQRLDGFAVTMPYKRTVIPFLDHIDETAAACGAVNIVERKGGKLIGHNTDGDGLVDALSDMNALENAATAAILGRGGAAVSAAYALKRTGVEPTLIVRTPSEHPAFHEETVENVSFHSDIFINATPLGMKGREDFPYFRLLDTLSPNTVVDMVYAPDGETALTREASKRGIKAADGAGMLRFQALRAFGIWTGITTE